LWPLFGHEVRPECPFNAAVRDAQTNPFFSFVDGYPGLPIVPHCASGVSDLMPTRMGASSGELELIVEGTFAKRFSRPTAPMDRGVRFTGNS
jgi:hypothetical protein